MFLKDGEGHDRLPMGRSSRLGRRKDELTSPLPGWPPTPPPQSRRTVPGAERTVRASPTLTGLIPNHRARDGPIAGAAAATTTSAAIGRNRTAPSAAKVQPVAVSSRNGLRRRRGQAAASSRRLAISTRATFSSGERKSGERHSINVERERAGHRAIERIDEQRGAVWIDHRGHERGQRSHPRAERPAGLGQTPQRAPIGSESRPMARIATRPRSALPWRFAQSRPITGNTKSPSAPRAGGSSRSRTVARTNAHPASDPGRPRTATSDHAEDDQHSARGSARSPGCDPDDRPAAATIAMTGTPRRLVPVAPPAP